MQLDQLLPDPITPAILTELLTREEWRRPAEGLCFEYKREYRPGLVPKAVAAFANNEGGFLFLGAETAKGLPVGYPGLDKSTEWPLQISNEILGNVSPLPAWRASVVPCPQDPNRVVVVVRVPQSSRAPHLVGGRVYVRSPGGSSDPITDRATLDRLYNRLRRDDVQEAASRLHPIPSGLPRDPHSTVMRSWRFSVVATPLPNDVPFPDLLTRQTYALLPGLFKGPLLDQGTSADMGEDSVTVRFRSASVTVFDNGRMHLLVRQAEYLEREEPGVVRPDTLFPFAAGLLAAQAFRDVHEVHVSVQLADFTNGIAKGGAFGTPSLLPDARLPDPWTWAGEMLTEPTSAGQALKMVENRLWRAAGVKVFDS